MMTVRALGMAASVLACSLPAAAQPNLVPLVAQAKADLEAAGVPTIGVGPCGPFRIVNLAAQRLPGAGLLAKTPPHNLCEWPAGSGNGYATDILCVSKTLCYDVLGGAETQNTPQVDPPNGYVIDAGDFRPPVPDPVAPAPAPPVVVTTKGEKGDKGDRGDKGEPGPPGAAADTAALTARVEQLEALLRNLTCKSAVSLPFFGRVDTSCTLVVPK